MAEPPTKKRRTSVSNTDTAPGPSSLTRSISPPPSQVAKRKKIRNLISSPFQLTAIKDLPASSNVDAVTLTDLLGDPLISECWEFNFLHDVDFLMDHFDEDTRSLVKVHVVHGFWKQEDPNRLDLQTQSSKYKNVQLHTAFMPEMFGTHHSKMLILFRHDDTAQVIIHTANMIPKDWTNMTNGVWKSPALPLLGENPETQSENCEVGSGYRFKFDLLSYLRAYNKRREVCKALVEKLENFDFSFVRGALVASVPGRHIACGDPQETRWGWAAMKHALRSVPVQPGPSEVVVQISSIATLGATDKWLQNSLFDSLFSSQKLGTRPDFKVVFPTADEIRRSLDGYASGGSIHTKIQSAQQAKQLLYLRPLFCHWANDAPDGAELPAESSADDHQNQRREAGRQRAAPHIKTYIRYAKDESIDWALLTSANVSKQAWGDTASGGQQEFRIASWEIGVLVWPDLFVNDSKMVGVFKKDIPSPADLRETAAHEGSLVGIRIPYNLPLQRYDKDEKPWVAAERHTEPDWMGMTWGG